MEREALVLYLENVRDLEVSKYKIEKAYQYESDRYQKDISNLTTTFREAELKKVRSFTGLIFEMIGAIVFTALTVGMFGIAESTMSSWMILILLSGAIALGLWMHVLTYNGDKKEAVKHNEEEQMRYMREYKTAEYNKACLAQREMEWARAKVYFEQQYKHAQGLLDNFYAMNIIPKPYRDPSVDRNRPLATACYLYDYMSSGRESFQMALISNQLEDGIRRIEAKLDIIIDHIGTAIYELRVMREENRENVNRHIMQNNRMLDSLRRMEIRQENIEDYARLSANYNQAQAYFNYAYFLR